MVFTLTSLDGVSFELENDIILQMGLFRDVLYYDYGLPMLFPVSGPSVLMPAPVAGLPIASITLDRVLTFCRHQAPRTYISDLDLSSLIDLWRAADFFEIQNLLDVSCDEIARLIRNMKPPEVFKSFNQDAPYHQGETEFYTQLVLLDPIRQYNIECTYGFKSPDNMLVNVESPRRFYLQRISEESYRKFLNAVIYGNAMFGAINKIMHARA